VADTIYSGLLNTPIPVFGGVTVNSVIFDTTADGDCIEVIAPSRSASRHPAPSSSAA